MSIGGGFDLPQQIVINTPVSAADDTTWWIVGIAVPVVLAVGGWFFKK